MHKERLLGLLTIVVAGAVWEIVTRSGYVNSISMVPLSHILATFFDLLRSGELFLWLGPSLYRLAAGFLLGAVTGVAIGLLMGYFRQMHNLLEPLTEILRPIPSPAYLPLVILVLGIDDEMKIFMIAASSFFPILLNTYSGVRAVDPVQVNTARTFGLSNRQIVRQIVIPAASPYIVTGMRVSLAISLILVVISEMVAANNGIGFFVLNAQRSFRVKEMYAGIIALAIIGYALNSLFLTLERRAMAWHIGATRKEAS